MSGEPKRLLHDPELGSLLERAAAHDWEPERLARNAAAIQARIGGLAGSDGGSGESGSGGLEPDASGGVEAVGEAAGVAQGGATAAAGAGAAAGSGLIAGGLATAAVVVGASVLVAAVAVVVGAVVLVNWPLEPDPAPEPDPVVESAAQSDEAEPPGEPERPEEARPNVVEPARELAVTPVVEPAREVAVPPVVEPAREVAVPAVVEPEPVPIGVEPPSADPPPAASSTLPAQLDLVRRARDATEAGAFDQALALLDRLEREHPDSPVLFDARLARVECLFRADRHDEGMPVVAALLSEDVPLSTRAQLLRLRGDVHMKRDACPEAVEDYRRALGLGLPDREAEAVRAALRRCAER